VATLRLATRGSPLALFQSELVAAKLAGATGEGVELVVVETSADRRADLPISAFAGQGAFVAEVEVAVLEGRADVAVHSAKDLPAGWPVPGLVLAAVPERADPRDVLVGSRLDDLAPGALVATGAARRRAQLAWLRPDLGFVELRGNIGTRLARVPPGGAAVVAMAALERLGLRERAAEVLPVSVLLPQVGQGAIACRCREDDIATRAVLALVDDQVAHRALDAERAFLARLGGGCDAPVGAYATPLTAGSSGGMRLEAMVAARDGHGLVRVMVEGCDPGALGESAFEALAERGAMVLLGRDGERAPAPLHPASRAPDSPAPAPRAPASPALAPPAAASPAPASPALASPAPASPAPASPAPAPASPASPAPAPASPAPPVPASPAPQR
jgi:hydroxymethylbilane synthase